MEAYKTEPSNVFNIVTKYSKSDVFSELNWTKPVKKTTEEAFAHVLTTNETV